MVKKKLKKSASLRMKPATTPPVQTPKQNKLEMLRSTKYSTKQLSIFILVFALIGGYFLFRSFAATTQAAWDSQSDFSAGVLTNTKAGTDGIVRLAQITVPIPASVTANDSDIGTGDNQFSYSGTWNYAPNDSSKFHSDDHYSLTTNDSVVYTFTGTQASIYVTKDNHHGIAAFSVDGGSETNFDEYAPVRTYQFLAFKSPVLSYGKHTVKMRVTGNKNTLSSDKVLTVDEAITTTLITTSVNDNTAGSSMNQINYTGTWSHSVGAGTDTGKYQADDHYSSTSGSTATMQFSGSQVNVYVTKDKHHGLVAISVDGGAETTVDEYASNRIYQSEIYSSPVLTNGIHTVKLRVTGSKDPSSTGTIITVDKIEAISQVTQQNYANSGSILLSYDASDLQNWTGTTNIAAVPTGTTLTYKYRSSTNNISWSAWNSTITQIPTGRYLQIEADFSTVSPDQTPALDKIVVNYQAPIDTTPPTISVTAPASGSTVSSNVSLSANASDNIGVAGVTFKVDGVTVGTEDTTLPYSVVWDSTKVTNGAHTVTAIARDTAGNVTQSSANITVNNVSGYFVSPSGNDSGSGTSGSPWKTVQHAVDTVPTGATVILNAGTYAPFIINKANITVTNSPGAAVLVQGQASVEDVIRINSSGVKVSGLTVFGCVPNATPSGGRLEDFGSSGVRINDGTTGVTVTGMTIRDSHGTTSEGLPIGCYGIFAHYANSSTISNNDVYHNGEGIQVLGGGKNTQIIGNQVHDNDVIIRNTLASGDDFGASGISMGYLDVNSTPGPTIKSNTIYTNVGPSHDYTTDGGAFEVFRASNMTYDGNNIFNNENVLEAGTNNGFPCSNIKFINNTVRGTNITGYPVLDPTHGYPHHSIGMYLRCNDHMLIDNNSFTNIYGFDFDIFTGGNFGGAIDHMTITNNTITQNGDRVWALEVNPSGQNFAINNNHYHVNATVFGAAFGWSSSTWTNLAAWRSATGFDLASTTF